MKIFIQIPCLNEEKQLAKTIGSIREASKNFSFYKNQKIEWDLLIIDDGSTDNTAKLARDLGIKHIIINETNKGLAYSFQRGLNECLLLGADYIVNTDGDNQYEARDIQKILLPILDDKADMVIGDRQIVRLEEFSFLKKLFQLVGSWFVRQVSNTHVKDAPSGFRAYSRLAASKINIQDLYTYTLENIIQAKDKNLRIVSVSVRTNPSLRKSRLIKSNFHYILMALLSITKNSMRYQSASLVKFFSYILFGSSLALYIFLIFNWTTFSWFYVKFLIVVATLLFMFATHFFIFSYSCFLYNKNRRLIEEILSKNKFEKSKKHYDE